jgi:hypothetical protein
MDLRPLQAPNAALMAPSSVALLLTLCAAFDCGPGAVFGVGQQRSGNDRNAHERSAGLPCDASLRGVLRWRSGTRLDESRANGTQEIRAGQPIESRTGRLPIKHEKKSKVHTLCTFGADAR